MTAVEIPLEGGNTNSSVSRIGNTVRRSQSKASSTVHVLLNHLHAAGFTACPKFLGIDEQSREILTYIEGDAAIPTTLWCNDETLIKTAQLLRSYHDASATLVASSDHVWGYSYPDITQHDVICHNDFAPYNFVFSDQLPVAIIDFDLAGPGPRIRDIAYAGYWMTPLSIQSDDMRPFAQRDIANSCQRLKLFCSSYGIQADKALLDMIAEVLKHMASKEIMIDMLGEDTANKLAQDGHLSHWKAEAASFESNRHLYERLI